MVPLAGVPLSLVGVGFHPGQSLLRLLHCMSVCAFLPPLYLESMAYLTQVSEVVILSSFHYGLHEII